MDNNLDRNKRGIKKSQLYVFYPNNNHSNNFGRVILLDESWMGGCVRKVLPALVPARVTTQVLHISHPHQEHKPFNSLPSSLYPFSAPVTSGL